MILYELKVFKFLKQKVTYNIQYIDNSFCHTFIYCIYYIQI